MTVAIGNMCHHRHWTQAKSLMIIIFSEIEAIISICVNKTHILLSLFLSLSYKRGVVWLPLACSGSLWVCDGYGWLWVAVIGHGRVELAIGWSSGLWGVSNFGHYVANLDRCYRWERVWEVSSWQRDGRSCSFSGWYRSCVANPLVSGWSTLVGDFKSWYLFLEVELVSTRDEIPKNQFCKIVVKLILLF